MVQWNEQRDSLACVHRGVELSREHCESCPGNVAIKTFVCGLFGVCSYAHQLLNSEGKQMQCCARCESRLAPPRRVGHNWGMDITYELIEQLRKDMDAAGDTPIGRVIMAVIALHDMRERDEDYAREQR
jgi:hypothetical protein